MAHQRIAYLPLPTFPEPVEDAAILATIGFAAALKCALDVAAFSIDLPRLSSGLGDWLIDVPGMVATAEKKSLAECARLQALVEAAAKAAGVALHVSQRNIILGGVSQAAAVQARSFDVALVPWSQKTEAVQDLAESLVFGSGRPTILVPPGARSTPLQHVALAWDGSHVAARALWDVLPLLADGGKLSVLTAVDDKPTAGKDLAGALAAQLERRGIKAAAVDVTLGDRTIADALQQAAIASGANMMAMGGYGHSRMRDFILGGATQGVIAKLQLPVLLSH
jgi:nucleotide-binding universal stress UspA family protein